MMRPPEHADDQAIASLFTAQATPDAVSWLVMDSCADPSAPLHPPARPGAGQQPEITNTRKDTAMLPAIPSRDTARLAELYTARPPQQPVSTWVVLDCPQD